MAWDDVSDTACPIARGLAVKKPKRFDYFATQKGKDLAPILLAIGAWGLRWDEYKDDEPAMKIASQDKSDAKEGPEPSNARPIFRFGDVHASFSSSYAIEREQRRLAFQTDKQNRR